MTSMFSLCAYYLVSKTETSYGYILIIMSNSQCMGWIVNPNYTRRYSTFTYC